MSACLICRGWPLKRRSDHANRQQRQLVGRNEPDNGRDGDPASSIPLVRPAGVTSQPSSPPLRSGFLSTFEIFPYPCSCLESVRRHAADRSTDERGPTIGRGYCLVG